MNEPQFTQKRPATPVRFGVLSSRRVRLASFAVISIGIFFATTISVLAIWDYTSPDSAWKALATFGVLSGAVLLFAGTNEWFGARLRELKN